MDCPKCNAHMNEIKVEVLQGAIVIDQCSSCKGLWFDNGEAEQLKKSWMSDFLDSGDPSIGKTYNRVRDISCPRCGKLMNKLTDKRLNLSTISTKNIDRVTTIRSDYQLTISC